MEEKIDDAINDLMRINYRLVFLREITNLEDRSQENPGEYENYSYGKALVIEDIQNEITRIVKNLEKGVK